MKLHELIQFKSKLEDKQDMFILPNLSDTEWQSMLSHAKIGVYNYNKKEVKSNSIYTFLSSAKLSFALSLAIIITTVVTYTTFSTPNTINDERSYNNASVSPRVEPPVVNVSSNNYI